jgi:anaerobic magnesium-protoporphyrin IX monomethyl ester cyclase
MTDIVFVHPPNTFSESYKEHELGSNKKYGLVPPIGLLYLASASEAKGFSVKIIDSLALGIGLEDTIKLIGQEHPYILGISATTYQSRAAVQLSKKIKEEFGNNMSVCLGGAHISSKPDFIKNFSYFNFGIIGEAEITFPKLAKDVIDGKCVNGLHYAEVPSDLDQLPFPARHLIDKTTYYEPGNETATIMATRGCPYQCTFCSITAISRKVRCRSAKNIVDEMVSIMDDYNNKFWFLDDSLTINRDGTNQLCNEIIERKLNVEWSCSTRVDLVNETLLKNMYNAGCKSIAFGIESGNERIRNEIIHKNIKDNEIRSVFRLCKKIGIQIHCFLMMGFPSETKSELKQTAEFCVKMGADIIGVHLTNILPGSELYEYAITAGMISEDIFDKYANGKISLNNLPRYTPINLTIDDLRDMRSYAYRKFYFRPSFIVRKAIRTVMKPKDLLNDLQMAKILLLEGRTPPELE